MPPTSSVEILLFQATMETWKRFHRTGLMSSRALCWVRELDGKSCSHIPHTPMAFLHPGPHCVGAEQRGSWRVSCICGMVGSSRGYLMWLHFQHPPTPPWHTQGAFPLESWVQGWNRVCHFTKGFSTLLTSTHRPESSVKLVILAKLFPAFPIFVEVLLHGLQVTLREYLWQKPVLLDP